MPVVTVLGEARADFLEEVASGPEPEPWAAGCKCPGGPGGKAGRSVRESGGRCPSPGHSWVYTAGQQGARPQGRGEPESPAASAPCTHTGPGQARDSCGAGRRRSRAACGVAPGWAPRPHLLGLDPGTGTPSCSPHGTSEGPTYWVGCPSCRRTERPARPSHLPAPAPRRPPGPRGPKDLR